MTGLAGEGGQRPTDRRDAKSGSHGSCPSTSTQNRGAPHNETFPIFGEVTNVFSTLILSADQAAFPTGDDLPCTCLTVFSTDHSNATIWIQADEIGRVHIPPVVVNGP